MSEGPIKREREAWKPVPASTPDARRVCFKSLLERRGYCGRVPQVSFDDWGKVTCADCLAARRADVQAAATSETT